jgi:3',5'-cyclic AMP phosphodiesterase CpdA
MYSGEDILIMTFIHSDETRDGIHRPRIETVPVREKRFVLAHVSDPHISCMDQIKKSDLLNKRLLGYLRWKLHRGAEHREEILTILLKDLQRIRPDHIAITGDLTHLSLPAEFKKVQKWLRSLGSPTQVTVIPGNHDTYVGADWHQTFAHWLDYMVSDTGCHQDGPVKGFDDLFPTLRVRGRIALIGVCTAHPSALHLATGRIGIQQLKKLETILRETAALHLFRIISIHHPPISGIVSRRRRLTDAEALRTVLARYGTELILHGHVHKTASNTLHTQAGLTPVVGAPSVTSSSRIYERRARYYVYKINACGGGWDVQLTKRLYSPDGDAFIPERLQRFYFPAE